MLTADQFAQTINQLKRQSHHSVYYASDTEVITHQIPKGLAVDEAVLLGKETATENQVSANGEEMADK
ncbi:MAG: hypothetical protein PSV17_02685 [Methylotenera sp.]|uniref:hypothetical protein n=1 Tax=Methylotenera sp. TaxID=2051956 RepID=UPI00248A170A|nr:hypothetical protein [Methylotenera sp.]MDI1308326.1 hypothetical protein [Methylotenera sp.]